MKLQVAAFVKYSKKGASSRLRFYQFIPWLAAQDIEVTIFPLFGDDYLNQLYNDNSKSYRLVMRSYLRRIRDLLQVRRYAVIWIEGELMPMIPPVFEKALRWLKVPYIVDYDDALFHNYEFQHKARHRWLQPFLGGKIDQVMKHATLVVAGNEYLAAHARAVGAAWVETMPTVIELQRYQCHVAPPNDPVIVGWIGAPPTVKYLEMIAPALKTIQQRFHIDIHVIGAAVAPLSGVDYQAIPWHKDTEIEQVCRFDIGIMPLPDDRWTRGKCGYKLIQYMACGKPVIASPVGVNEAIVVAGANGFLAKSLADWETALTQLCESLPLRQQQGQYSRQLVEKYYHVGVVVPKLVQYFHQVAGHR